MSKVNLEVYLFFKGQAEEAMNFYKGIFGGEVTGSRFSEMPAGTPEMPGTQKDWFMHCSLEGGDIKLMASDSAKASDKAAKVELSLGGTDEVQMRKMFDGLAEEGKVNMALEKQFWGDVFGSVTDKYGIDWMMNIGSDD